MHLESVLIPEARGEKDIAVIPRKHLFGGAWWSGVRTIGESGLFELLSKHMEFHERTDKLELDANLKQIIPYFLVRKENAYLTALRRNKTGDRRLHGARLIGFGGHLRAGDIAGTMSNWLTREFKEEIHAETVSEIQFLGLVNDDSDMRNSIGKVHVGPVFEIAVQGNAAIRERDKFEYEEFLPLRELTKRKSEMESWSALVTDYLISRA